jgi:hypothetical protein
MSESLILVTVLLTLLIVLAFGFTGCAKFDAAEPDPVSPPGTPPGPPPGPAPGVPYEALVAATPGFAGHWRLNETAGNIAKVAGPLAPDADGTYVLPGIALGRDGAMHHKDAKDFAPELSGGHVEIGFDGRLNPSNDLRFSVELWARPSPSAGGTTQVVISSHFLNAAAGRNRGYEIALVRVPGQAHQRVRGRVFSSGAAAPDEAGVVPTAGDPAAWRHVVMTYDGTAGSGKKLKVYVSVAGTTATFADEQAGVSYQNVQAGNGVGLRFGSGHADGGGPADPFAGLVDEVAFYNTALALADVESHFKAF